MLHNELQSINNGFIYFCMLFLPNIKNHISNISQEYIPLATELNSTKKIQLKKSYGKFTPKTIYIFFIFYNKIESNYMLLVYELE